MVASSFLLRGYVHTAIDTMNGLTTLLRTQEERFKKVINDPSTKSDVQERPHVRFTLSGKSGKWSHAQNDALGYALWLRFVLANSARLIVNKSEYEFYRLFPLYFEAVEYWRDADSGAWEEDRMVHSSSVGAVTAGLRAMEGWLETNRALNDDSLQKLVQRLIREGTTQLQLSLPYESPPKRYADAAVLFLIHPAEIVSAEQENAILEIVQRELVRRIGIIRYVGDSYYGQDYPDWFTEDQLTSDFSEQMEIRNSKLLPGYEAQWCLFDPLLSVIYGKKFLANPEEKGNLQKQTEFFNRSLSQLTQEMQCPELYFWRSTCNSQSEHANWIPNPHKPLAWTQANLALALDFMKRSATLL